MLFKYIFFLYLRIFGVGGELLRMDKGPTVGYHRYILLCLRNKQFIFLSKTKRYSFHSQSYFFFIRLMNSNCESNGFKGIKMVTLFICTYCSMQVNKYITSRRTSVNRRKFLLASDRALLSPLNLHIVLIFSRWFLLCSLNTISPFTSQNFRSHKILQIEQHKILHRNFADVLEVSITPVLLNLLEPEFYI